jgi:putative intracellular protease/amidase
MRLAVVLTDGFADWEAALLLAEARRSGGAEVTTIAAHEGPIHSMGGLPVGPTLPIADADPTRFQAVIIPGGTWWEESDEGATPTFLRRAHEEGALIGAICAGTIPLARSGLLHQRSHTSNGHEYLARHIDGFDESASYDSVLCVRDDSIITASGLGYVEFAAEMLEALDILSDRQDKQWFELFKRGERFHETA